MLLPLLEGLNLSGAFISLDALYGRKTIADGIIEKGADYLIALKSNNKNYHKRVIEHFNQTSFGKVPDSPAALDGFDETHGRLTRRSAFVSSDPNLLENLNGWRDLKRVIAVETITYQNNVHGGGSGKKSSDIRYILRHLILMALP